MILVILYVIKSSNTIRDWIIEDICGNIFDHISLKIFVIVFMIMLIIRHINNDIYDHVVEDIQDDIQDDVYNDIQYNIEVEEDDHIEIISYEDMPELEESLNICPYNCLVTCIPSTIINSIFTIDSLLIDEIVLDSLRTNDNYLDDFLDSSLVNTYKTR